jgi:hypothetical protein
MGRLRVGHRFIKRGQAEEAGGVTQGHVEDVQK